MISVDEARQRILAAARRTPAESVSLLHSVGRVLASDAQAHVTQPPADMSAMDGYAVRADDVANTPATLRLVGTAQAGQAWGGVVGAGEAVRIYTGAPVPEGADTIAIQENVDRDRDQLTVREPVAPGRHIRRAGSDFRRGEAGVPAGTVLDFRLVSLLAAMNVAWVSARRRPRVAILSTGDELVAPGQTPGPAQIVNSNGPALVAFVTERGGEPVDLGIAPDRLDPLQTAFDAAVDAEVDLLLVSGGASVGDYDLVQSALRTRGLELDFWKVAMRPGKPLMFGRLGGLPVIGLPGNPVSSAVCALLFVEPLLRRMQGLPDEVRVLRARLGRDLPANDHRQDHLRATLEWTADGTPVATPLARQDSAMLSDFAKARALIVRPPHAPPAVAGESVTAIPLCHSDRSPLFFYGKD